MGCLYKSLLINMRIIETISTACSVGEKKQTNIIFIFFIVIIILLTAYWFRVTRCADHPSRDLARDHSRTQAAACRLTPLPSLSPRRPLLPLESHLTVTRSSTVCRPATMTHEQRNIIKKKLLGDCRYGATLASLVKDVDRAD